MRRLAAITATLAVAAAGILSPTAHAEGDSTEYAWGTARAVTSGSTFVEMTSSHTIGELAVASALRQTPGGFVIDIYYARGEGDWTFDTSVASEVGTDPGLPSIATDGQGWALAWQFRNAAGNYTVMIASKAEAGSATPVVPRDEGTWESVVPTQPQLAGLENARPILDPSVRYTLAFVEARDVPTASRIITRDFANGSWRSTTSHESGDPTGQGVVSNPKIALSGNGAAAVGFEVTVAGVSTLQVLSRSASANGLAWSRPLPAGSGQLNASVDGAWDIDVPQQGASTVSTIWSRKAGNGAVILFARTNVFFGSVAFSTGLATATPVDQLSLSAARLSNDVAAWVEQAAPSGTEPLPYKVRSLAVNTRTNQTGIFDIQAGEAISTPLISLTMDPQDHVWLALQRLGRDLFTRVGVTDSDNSAVSTVWTGAAITLVGLVGPSASVRPRGVAMLAGDPEVAQPRVLWNDLSLPGTTYRVVATQRVLVPRNPPQPPTNVTAVAGDTSARVRWQAPVDTGTSPITGYLVVSTPGQLTCRTAGELTCRIDGLTNGTPYVFDVTALSDHGASLPSAPSSAVTPVSTTRPGPPRDVTAVAGNASAEVRWTAPANAGVSPVVSYVATANPGGAACQTAAELSCTIQGLTNGTAYTFTVVASNAQGAGQVSEPSNAATPSAGAVPPSAPTAVTATAGDAEATVIWSPPAVAGSSAVTGYLVASTPAGHTCQTDADTLECRFRGLVNGTSYTFAVSALNGVGPGVAAVSNPVTPTAAPAVRPSPPETLRVKARKKGQVVLRWSASLSPDVVGYRVGIKKGSGAWRKANVGDVLTKTYRVKTGTGACYRVAAISDTGVTSRWTPKKCVVSKR